MKKRSFSDLDYSHESCEVAPRAELIISKRKHTRDTPVKKLSLENQPNIVEIKSLQDLVKVSKKGATILSSKPLMNQNALRFKQNIIECLADAPGSRYECIYKNLLREFRQYFQTKFEEFMLKTLNQKESFSKNTKTNKILFQF